MRRRSDSTGRRQGSHNGDIATNINSSRRSHVHLRGQARRLTRRWPKSFRRLNEYLIRSGHPDRKGNQVFQQRKCQLFDVSWVAAGRQRWFERAGETLARGQRLSTHSSKWLLLALCAAGASAVAARQFHCRANHCPTDPACTARAAKLSAAAHVAPAVSFMASSPLAGSGPKAAMQRLQAARPYSCGARSPKHR
jgi:hypothetical protein